MRLIDLDPKWVDYGERRGLGISFKCMLAHCTGRLFILFANPLDGGPAYEGDSWSLMWDLLTDDEKEGPITSRSSGKHRWTRTGDTFDTLSMTPSVDAHECGHLTLNGGIFR